MNNDELSLGQLFALGPRDFVAAAYAVVLGRAPTAKEQEDMLAALMQGDARSWLLGSLRYGREGRRRAIALRGLRTRYLAHCLFRVPFLGRVLEWAGAIVRLPVMLRHIRAARQSDAEQLRQMRGEDFVRINELQRLLATLSRNYIELDARFGDFEAGSAQLPARYAQLERQMLQVSGELRTTLGSVLPPPLGDTLEVFGEPLAALARERAGLPPETSVASLSPDARYTLFEAIFYESPRVAIKQRVYISYLDHDLSKRWPFLDLGCGRGEFLRILRDEGIEAVGVDVRPSVLAPLRAERFNVLERNLVEFLEADQGLYSGASLLQVAEHLRHDEIERVIARIADRLVPGAPIILETPNPLSPFALAVFYTDPTHVTPLPPERMRYQIEAAGFERARTLFQARIPTGHYVGSDPRAYYADYAIIAYRSIS